MAENIRFLVAHCRNAQKLRGAGFLEDLSRRTGLPPGELSLVDPTQAILLRREIDRHVVDGVKSGAVRRQGGLSLTEAAMILREFGVTQPDQPVYAFLCHSEEFPFSVRLSLLLGAWRAVLEFDGDTVSVVTPDLRNGLVLDVWSPDEASVEYQIDTWGDWRR